MAEKAVLVLEDGSVYHGYSFGAGGDAHGASTDGRASSLADRGTHTGRDVYAAANGGSKPDRGRCRVDHCAGGRRALSSLPPPLPGALAGRRGSA